MAAPAQPFRLHIADSAIDDLRERLARTRFPDQAPGDPWAYGADVAYLKQLVEHWRHRFDWRVQEARFNAFPQFKVPLHGIDLHFLHVGGSRVHTQRAKCLISARWLAMVCAAYLRSVRRCLNATA